MTVFRLQPEIQNYAWGSPRAIADLLGQQPSGKPEAELWMGVHPKAPAPLAMPYAGATDLAQLIAGDPDERLGEGRSELPFLFKVLAADRPLSLQAHPNLAQARAGFDSEEASGVPREAAHRNYKDRNHKPELIFALTEFSALSGFRTPAESVEMLRAFGCAEREELAEAFTALEAGRLRPLFEALFALPQGVLDSAVKEALRRASSGSLSGEAARVAPVVATLADAYPGDSGVLASLLLNYVVLSPGEAMYLPAGNLHSYLSGLGLEVMASSDNVLRGGLTPKHIDVEELCRVLRFEPLLPERIFGTVRAGKDGAFGAAVRRVYETPAAEFELSIIESDGGGFQIPGPAIVLVLDGDFECPGCSEESTRLERGSSAFVSAGDSGTWNGKGRLGVAALPASD